MIHIWGMEKKSPLHQRKKAIATKLFIAALVERTKNLYSPLFRLLFHFFLDIMVCFSKFSFEIQCGYSATGRTFRQFSAKYETNLKVIFTLSERFVCNLLEIYSRKSIESDFEFRFKIFMFLANEYCNSARVTKYTF